MKTFRAVLDIGIAIIFFVSLFLTIYNGIGAFSELMEPQEVYDMSVTYMAFTGIGICMVVIRFILLSFFPKAYEPSPYNDFGTDVCDECYHDKCICDEE